MLFKSVDSVPFVENEVFSAAVHAQGSSDDVAIPPYTSLTIERRKRTISGGYLPAVTDGSFDGYERRIAVQLNGLRYALMVNAFHAFHFPLWARERDFFTPLWERVGLPLSGAITTLFHGTYEHTPVGVHRDRFATFMFGLRGHKRMRFWANRPWTHPVTTVLDYEQYIPESFTAEVEPGDLLYWPSTYYHVGESAAAAPATSVNIGVPREEHSVDYEIDELLVDLDPATMVNARSGVGAQLPAVAAPLASSGADSNGVLSPAPPAALDQALHLFAELNLDDRLTMVSLRRWTAGGFEPVPTPAPLRLLADDDIIRSDPRCSIEFAADGMCAVNGHTSPTSLSLEVLRRTLEPLRDGRPIRVRDLPPESRYLLAQLESFRGVIRDGVAQESTGH